MTDLSTLTPNQFLLYADDGYDSHVVRLLLEEKEVKYHLVMSPERSELTELNPYATLPILASRELVLYEIGVMFEYFEERLGANKLLPPTPQERAKIRLLAWRLQQDWLKLGRILLTHPDSFDKQSAIYAKKCLSDSLITLSPLFARTEFFMSDNFGVCDVWLAPLLWRLPDMGIELPEKHCRPLINYMERVFARPTFKRTLTIPQEHHHD
ncbi:glutathione S-transferase N-terminal domain-containing protein [Moraxella oblonga]|uniref:glutathione S-transferase N-terminal domain-containing protein n=1 Tax=Moraxella oblonga TaxID=200413 RepID=UPI00082D37D9|nr:glutathione S-transferase N-terminal domain-containing protein [Moraxella oblonga]